MRKSCFFQNRTLEGRWNKLTKFFFCFRTPGSRDFGANPGLLADSAHFPYSIHEKHTQPAGRTRGKRCAYKTIRPGPPAHSAIQQGADGKPAAPCCKERVACLVILFVLGGNRISGPISHTHHRDAEIRAYHHLRMTDTHILKQLHVEGRICSSRIFSSFLSTRIL